MYNLQLLGCAILGIGIWLHIAKGSYAEIAPTFKFLSATALCIAAGAIVLVVGFFGCCGAIMENQCMLLTVRNVSFDIFTTALFPFTFDVLPTRRLSPILTSKPNVFVILCFSLWMNDWSFYSKCAQILPSVWKKYLAVRLALSQWNQVQFSPRPSMRNCTKQITRRETPINSRHSLPKSALKRFLTIYVKVWANK